MALSSPAFAGKAVKLSPAASESDFSQVPTRRRETARRRNPKFGEGLRREKSERCKECGANYGGNMLIISTISSRDLLFGK
jgi:hypothetical protein